MGVNNMMIKQRSGLMGSVSQARQARLPLDGITLQESPAVP